MEEFLINAAAGAISVIVISPFIWMWQTRKNRREEIRQEREEQDARRGREKSRQDEIAWEKEFADTPLLKDF